MFVAPTGSMLRHPLGFVPALTLLFIYGAAQAQTKDIQEVLRPIAATNYKWAKDYPRLTALQEDSEPHSTGAFNDPNYDPLASPAFLAELAESTLEAAQYNQGIQIREALGILLNKMKRLMVALEYEKDIIVRSKISETDRNILMETYVREFTAVAALLARNIDKMDYAFFRKYELDYQNMKRRFAPGYKLITPDEYFLIPSEGRQQKLEFGEILNLRPSKFALLMTAVYSRNTPRGQSDALYTALYAIAENRYQSSANRALAFHSLIQIGFNNSELLNSALAFISNGNSDSLVPDFYTDLARRTLNSGLKWIGGLKKEKAVSKLARQSRKDKSQLLDLLSVPSAKKTNCGVVLAGNLLSR